MKRFVRGFFCSLRNWRLNGLLYLFNLLPAGIVAVNLHSVLRSGTAGHGLDERMLAGWDTTILADFVYAKGNISELIGVAVWMVILWALFNVVLAGGVWNTLRIQSKTSGEPFSLTAFLTGVGAFAGRFLGLFLLSLAALLVPFIVFVVCVLAAQGSSAEPGTAALIGIGGTVAGALFLLIQCWFDFARIHVVEFRTGVFRAAASGLAMLIGNFGRCVWLIAVWFAALALLMAALHLINNSLDPSNGLMALLAFAAGQLAILIRVFMRTALQTAELDLFLAAAPPPAPAEPAEAQVETGLS